ncbi:MAG: putative hydrolase [Friedmanniella sp.]|nr:putative hydrolase [Friedmanniella sp.]
MTTPPPGWVPRLSGALAQPERADRAVALRPGRGGRAAAVLILVAEGPLGPEVVFVERAATLRTHANQIAFPGGAADVGDRDLVDTALREATEEVGVDRAGVRVLGVLPPAHVAVSGFDVTGVVGWWQQPVALTAVDVSEVASVAVVPVAVLSDPANRAAVHHPSGYTGPAFAVADHLIWGLTAHLLDGVLELAGWQQPWDHLRRLPIPDRYLTGRPTPGGPDAH